MQIAAHHFLHKCNVQMNDVGQRYRVKSLKHEAGTIILNISIKHDII